MVSTDQNTDRLLARLQAAVQLKKLWRQDTNLVNQSADGFSFRHKPRDIFAFRHPKTSLGIPMRVNFEGAAHHVTHS